MRREIELHSELYRDEAQEILNLIAIKMNEILYNKEDSHAAYQEDWWDVWQEAVNELKLTEKVIDDEKITYKDEVYSWKENQMLSYVGDNGIALEITDFVEYTQEE